LHGIMFLATYIIIAIGFGVEDPIMEFGRAGEDVLVAKAAKRVADVEKWYKTLETLHPQERDLFSFLPN